MTDREMLELAAKAAGYDCRWEGDGDFINLEDGLPWNPLTDDGDALRLAVKLGLCVQVLNQYGETQVFRKTGYTLEKHGTDPDAATRRAVFRTAVEIGRNMK